MTESQGYAESENIQVATSECGGGARRLSRTTVQLFAHASSVTGGGRYGTTLSSNSCVLDVGSDRPRPPRCALVMIFSNLASTRCTLSTFIRESIGNAQDCQEIPRTPWTVRRYVQL